MEYICSKLYMKLSTPKTIVMLFGKMTMENKNPIFKISNQSISVKNTVTYLGLTIDSNLNRLKYLDNVRNKIMEFTVNI